METLLNEKTNAANEKVNDLKNTVTDTDNKVKEGEKELDTFIGEDQVDEETGLITFEKLHEKAVEKLNEARMARELENVGLEYYHKGQLKISSAIKDIKDINRKIIKESGNREVVDILKKIRYKKIEIKNNVIKNNEEENRRFEILKYNTNHIFEMAKLDFVELNKYDSKGDSAPYINKDKEYIINNYKKSIIINLKTKEALMNSNKYFSTLENKIRDYNTSKTELSVQITEARNSNNKVLVDTLENMQDNIAETEEALKKEISLYTVEKDRLKEKDLTEVQKTKKIIDDYKNKFKTSLETDITIIEDEVKESDIQRDTADTNDTDDSKNRIPTQI